ncbi:MAG: rhodanese-like domain-containing protein [Gammaproteobacteria bacterium]|nr:rhodanese-like domain-containing protein [Gammaproteobacteria bacterium]
MFGSIKEVDAPELAQRLDAIEKSLKIIDVREIHEISRGTVPGAKPMPMASIPVRLNELTRDEELYFICHSGARSAQVCMFLQQQGFDNVYNLRGGMLGWARSGLPIGMAEAI